MQSHRIRRFVVTTLGAAVLTSGAGAAWAQPMPQTREHILLARQVNVPSLQSGVPVELSVGTGPTPTASTDGQPCSDWTNPDGTHGTNCPAPAPSGGGGRGSSAVVSLGKLGRVE